MENAVAACRGETLREDRKHGFVLMFNFVILHKGNLVIGIGRKGPRRGIVGAAENTQINNTWKTHERAWTTHGKAEMTHDNAWITHNNA